MIEALEQPKLRIVNEKIRLVKYYPYYKKTLQWYQDPVLCRQVDRIDHVYDLELLKRMYGYLSGYGECYYIKYCDQGRWRLVGDVSLYNGMIAIVICREYQNRHIGRAVIDAMIARAKEVGWQALEAEVYDFNVQSQKAFEAAGFVRSAEEIYCMEL